MELGDLYGELPLGDTLLAACDSHYLHQHVPALVASADRAGNNLHVHVVNPTAADWAWVTRLKLGVDSIRFTVTGHDCMVSEDSEIRRAQYACSRFMVAPVIMEATRSRMLIIDADCIIMRHIDFPDADLGLFLRPHEEPALQVAAGVVYVTPDAYGFLKTVQLTLESNAMRWFIDQLVLHAVYQQTSVRERCRFIELDQSLMDWEFVEGACIWTGKGKRKYENQVYLAAKEKFMTLGEGRREMFWCGS